MKIHYIYLLLIATMHFTTLGAQAPKWTVLTTAQVTKELEYVNNWYVKNTNYSVNVTHNSYENYTNTKAYESINGYFYRNNNNYHSYLLGVHTLQNERIKIVFDSINGVIAISNVEQLTANIADMKNYINNLKYCTAIKQLVIGTDKKIRLEYLPKMEINAVEMTLAQDGTIKLLVMYYGQGIAKNKADPKSVKIKPRVSIVFSNYKTKIPFNYERTFSEVPYLKQNKKRYLLQDKYSKYKLFDHRLNI
jgi:hypothetical protein